MDYLQLMAQALQPQQELIDQNPWNVAGNVFNNMQIQPRQVNWNDHYNDAYNHYTSQGVAPQKADALARQWINQQPDMVDKKDYNKSMWMNALGNLVGSGLQTYGRNQAQKEYSDNISAMAQALQAGSPEERNTMLEDKNLMSPRMKTSLSLFDISREIENQNLERDMQREYAKQQMGLNNKMLEAQFMNKLDVDKQLQIDKNKFDLENTGMGSKRMDQVDSLRKELSGMPEFKDYSKASTSFRALQQLAKSDNPQSDLPFVYELVKILDPNSVVREGEIKLTDQANPLAWRYIDQLQAVANKGARIDPEIKTQLLAEVKYKMDEMEKQYKTVSSGIKRTAEARNLPWDQIEILPVQPMPRAGETREQFKARIKAGG